MEKNMEKGSTQRIRRRKGARELFSCGISPWKGCSKEGSDGTVGAAWGLLNRWPSWWCVAWGCARTTLWMPVLTVGGLGPQQTMESPAWKGSYQDRGWSGPSPHLHIHTAVCPVGSWDHVWRTAGVDAQEWAHLEQPARSQMLLARLFHLPSDCPLNVLSIFF